MFFPFLLSAFSLLYRYNNIADDSVRYNIAISSLQSLDLTPNPIHYTATCL